MINKLNTPFYFALTTFATLVTEFWSRIRSRSKENNPGTIVVSEGVTKVG